MPRPPYESTTELIPWYSTQHGLPDSSGGTACIVWERGWYGGVTPGYPAVKQFNAYGMDVRKRSYGVFNHKAVRDFWGDTYTYKGSSAGLGISQANVEQHMPTLSIFNNSGESKARAKVIGDIQRIKVNVAQNVAEYRQVSGMFSTNLNRIASAYRALRHGDVKGLGRSLSLRKRHQQSLLNRGPLNVRRNAPSIWLELQYGWVPLCSDIYTGMQDFYKRVESGYTIRARGSGSETSRDETQLDPDVGDWKIRDNTTRKTFVKYIIDYQVDHSNLANLDDWGVTNPALLAWELVPYSFVVDWFLPVGDWLSQVGYSLGLYYQRGIRSGIARANTVRNVKTPPNTNPYWAIFEGSGQDSFSTDRFRREILLTWPSPVLPTDSFDENGLRGKRITNALSLLALAFDRRKR